MNRDNMIMAYAAALKDGNLPQFVIYNSPSDYPGKYVVRMWLIGHKMGPTNMVVVVDDLKQARDLLPPGMFCMERAPEDDDKIVETWF